MKDQIFETRSLSPIIRVFLQGAEPVAAILPVDITKASASVDSQNLINAEIKSK